MVNPDPERGLSSSLQVGFEAIGPEAEAVLVALGDQPLVSAAVIRSLVDAPAKRGQSIVVPVYPEDRGRNPVLVRRAAFGLVAEATGDRGLGPVLDAHPEVVSEIPLEAANPDIDTPADLGRAIEASWAARVRANREQVERLREVPDGTDFYAPVSSLFRADPTRTDDPVLDALLALVRSGETWLDVGAGAGRFALPIARALDPSGGSVIALDPSRSMLEGLLEIAEDYAVENVRTIEARWPPADARAAADFDADVALIAHVGYDIEADRPVRRRPRGGCRAAVCRRPDGAGPGRGGEPVLAAGPRRGARAVAGASRPARVARGAGTSAVASSGSPSSRAGSSRARRSRASSVASCGSTRAGRRKRASRRHSAS